MKRLICCSDGTWNKPGEKDRGVVVKTNVEKIFNCICPVDENGTKQLKAYDEGVGTGYTFKDKMLGGLTGAGIDKNIKDVYSFLVLNYEPGDHIYLFGFSRGAYTARSLAGFIRNCGILKVENLHLIDRAYELYRDRNDYTSPDSDMMKAFKSNFSHEAGIKFIGVWDTVGSLGLPVFWLHTLNTARYKFHDQTLSSKVDYAYHALCIDDKRVLFTPTLWEKSETVKNDSTHQQKMEQRWFAGVHSNIGGGYADCGLSDLPLKWMIEKAVDTGLCFDNKALGMLKPDCKGEIRDSYTFKYWLWFPKLRKVIHDGISPGSMYNGTIDESVLERERTIKCYKPKNLLPFLKR